MNRISMILLTLTLPLLAGRGCESVVNTNDDMEGMVSGINSFGLDVYKGIYSPEQILISPLSLSSALAMTTLGAGTTTEAQMKEVLGFRDCTASQIGGFHREVMKFINTADSSVSVEMANSIWVNELIKVKKSFIGDCSRYFGAEAHNADFDAQETLDTINRWCSDNTEGKIPSILDRLDGSQMMLLLNALYFKGNWQFNRFNTVSPGEFTDIDGKVGVVQMMSVRKIFGYTSNEDFQIIELPYGNGTFAMDILLPAEGKSLDETAKAIDIDRWNNWMDDLEPQTVLLRMPKFKMGCETQLADVVAGLGMAEAFTGEADFSKISNTPLMIDFIKQKTYIDVNEEGSEAAAVTAVGMKATSAGPVEYIEMNVDHPFIFSIREKTSGLIFFIGHYSGK